MNNNNLNKNKKNKQLNKRNKNFKYSEIQINNQGFQNLHNKFY